MVNVDFVFVQIDFVLYLAVQNFWIAGAVTPALECQAGLGYDTPHRRIRRRNHVDLKSSCYYPGIFAHA